MSTENTVLSPPGTRYRLAPGYHLIPAEGGWLLCRPDGCFARLRIPTELGEEAARALAGEPQAPELNGDQLEGLLSSLVAEGAAEVVAGVSSTESDPAVRRVALEGRGETACLLAEILKSAGLAVELGSEISDGSARQEETRQAPDVWVSCADWLPDERFQAVDDWCVENKVAWHGFYAEGDRFHLGPFWLPDDPRTVRYADARARRLSAEVHPEGLLAYWRYVAANRRVNPAQPVNPAEAALIAGALAADILAWSKGETPPSHGHQLAYNRPTGCWRRHPVLPVPRGLMTERLP